MTDKPVIWVHADALSAHNSAFVAHPGAPAIFVFDDVVLDGYNVSLKRILFMYECLLEMPVEIQRGDVAACVVAFGRRHRATRVATVGSPSPRFRQLAGVISESLPVEIFDERPLVNIASATDLGRFSRYWKVAERSALRIPDERAPDHVSNLLLPGLD